ncbi:integrase catalytic domain-containing protein [Trichonephila clavipes]|nr:integrase catalytic domain-containing protein [Trichonephila clavipes]
MLCEPTPLLADRVENFTVFEVIGIYFAWSLFLKNGEKVWVALFTCAVYRAIHLELVASLSTDSFLLALRRFISRRGRPKVIYSDNGSNFRGAFQELSSLDWKTIMRETNNERIVWKFNPPTAS